MTVRFGAQTSFDAIGSAAESNTKRGAVLNREVFAQSTSRAAAELIRARLLANECPSPERFRSSLSRVPTQDHDAWLDLLMDVEAVPADGLDLPRGCVPYLPCPVSGILSAVDQAGVTSDDVFVDVGSGTGRALGFVHLLTGAACIGVEIQSALMQLATERCQRFNLHRVQFIRADILDSIPFIRNGTVFFLYCPFSGERLERLLDELERIARVRPIRICCVDMAPLQRAWLERICAPPSQCDVFVSR